MTRLAILDVVEKFHLSRHGEACLFTLLVQSSKYGAADLPLEFVKGAVQR